MRKVNYTITEMMHFGRCFVIKLYDAGTGSMLAIWREKKLIDALMGISKDAISKEYYIESILIKTKGVNIMSKHCYNQFEGAVVYCGLLSCKYRDSSGRCLLAEETGKYPQVHCKNYFIFAEEVLESEVEE